ncbi:uncharacterized protein STEHIDRAFT_136038 [Stereum hirsutum FP-91666 SS1]|uniref:uncharacterized protein n=1 Tax=Stereum hirsutum (strain FP-91666) TaxID=721885 RepID=UPI000440CD56|nr:uncharacterized protein STEHIDRAFT_136038 [Stereum hirsutum FP-91666 SS1]EIM91939.1 hypothetical protein STEHIDRAFT_136038 [Stereum hirsutum FP-91666 SS1]
MSPSLLATQFPSHALVAPIAGTLRKLGSLSPSIRSLDSLPEDSAEYSPSSASSSCSFPSDASSDATISDTASFDATYVRPNEHLAVLLPKHLWKPDSQAASCETFTCPKRFSIFERRHHCRKCGGIFCATCSSRRTSLLDTSNLDFLHPPRNTPIAQFASPTSPLYAARVCDACFDQLYGCPTPRTPEPSHAPLAPVSAPLPVTTSPRSRTSSRSSSIVILTPPDGQSIAPAVAAIRRRSIRQQRLSLPPPSDPSVAPEVTSPVGELDSYPLRLKSEVCKRTGGGRWTPKKCPIDAAARLPGRRPLYEVEMEQEEERQRRARENPVVKDGDFQIRIARDLQPGTPYGPCILSTF